MGPGTAQSRLQPLLQPRSVAVVGASRRPGSVGRRTIENLLTGGYEGSLYAVNPGYDSVCGVRCFPDLEALPETVEHVVLALGDARIETALEAAIAHGARAATMMSQLVLVEDGDPPLRARVERRIAEAGLVVCGANGMGFYNFADGIWVCGFDTRPNHLRGGNVTLISHSGSGMSGIVDCEERIDFNLAVSAGQELSVTMDEYMDWALDREETRVIGLFMETARNPAGLIRAFEKANRRGIPVVVLKVGRSELAARMAVTHSGAVSGRDDAYRALFDRYGVQSVSDMHELATALMMFAQPHTVSGGGLATLHDSGGEQQLMVDLATDLAVPLASLSPATVTRLEKTLDPGLAAVNPLDGWGAGGPGADDLMCECMAALMSDPDTAIGAVVHDRAPRSGLYAEYFDYLRAGHAASGKPAFLVSNHQGSGCDPAAVDITREGFPVIDGLRPFLAGVRCLFGWRDYRARAAEARPAVEDSTRTRWRRRLAAAGGALPERESTALLRDFGIPAVPVRQVEDASELASAAGELGYPLALKTAEPGVLHKSDRGGVHLHIHDWEQLRVAWAELCENLGPRALLSPMAPAGVEMLLGLVRDEQFGPLVLLGFGGIRAEALRDVACAMPPFGAPTARRLLDSLRLRALLDGGRNQPAPDMASFCDAAARFSVLAAALGDVIAEADVNPVIVHSDGCVAVDSLIVGGETQ